jgi:MSHA biogenesis protein MshK
MDEAVKTSMKRAPARARTVLLAALLAWSGVAGAGAAAQSAQALQDPTRPPAAASAPAQAGAGQSGTPAAPQLQAVRVGAAAGGLRIAVIDGESVRVGENFRGARVVRIADNEVELARGGERQVLRLYAQDGAPGMTRVAPAAHRLAKGEQ